MTEELYHMLIERFPPKKEDYQINTYEAWERIYIFLNERKFARGPSFDSQKKIDGLAKRLFDVNFRWGKTYYGSDEQIPTIIFEPIIVPKSDGGTIEMLKYGEYYSGHSIEIRIPCQRPEITINTGNRGVTFLHPGQRKKYFDFVVGVHRLFLENARKP